MFLVKRGEIFEIVVTLLRQDLQRFGEQYLRPDHTHRLNIELVNISLFAQKDISV